MMHLSSLIFAFTAATFSATSVAATSFGGVNHYFLAALDRAERQSVIRNLHNSGVRIICTFVRPEIYDSEKGNPKAKWPDVESPMGRLRQPPEQHPRSVRRHAARRQLHQRRAYESHIESPRC